MKVPDRHPSARSALCLSLVVLLLSQGCVSHKARPGPIPSVETTPVVRSLASPPASIEALGSIGVTAAAGPLESSMAEPPAGWAGGFRRGASAGAVATVAGGLSVAALPFMGSGGGNSSCGGSLCAVVLGWALGWTALGVAAAPVGAVVGGIVGAVKAQSSEEVERGKAGLINAAAEAKVPDSIRDEVIRLGLERTGRALVPLTLQGPKSDDLDVDTVLEILVRRAELERRTISGKWTPTWTELEPEFNLRVSVDVRLMKVPDGNVLFSKSLDEYGPARQFPAWTADDARAFRQGLEEASSHLALQIVDYVFRTPPPAIETNEEEPVRPDATTDVRRLDETLPPLPLGERADPPSEALPNEAPR